MRSTCRSPQAWSEALAGLARLAVEDLAVWSDRDVRDGLLALLPAANQLSAFVSALVDVFDSRTLARSDGLRSTRSWLTGFGRVSQGAATGWLRQGRLMRALPTMAEQALAGAVSAEHLRKVDDLVTQIGLDETRQFEAALAESATESGPRALAKECERIRAWVDPDAAAPRPDAIERRGLTISRRGSLFNVRGRLDLEGGALVLTAMDALMRPPAGDDPRTPEQRRADAFVDLARQALIQGELPRVGGVRPHLGILVTPEMLMERGHGPSTGPTNATQGHAADDSGTPPSPVASTEAKDALGRLGVPTLPEPPWLQWAGDVPAVLAQRIACDSDIWRAVLDPATGLPLEVGRAHRIVPYWIRKALYVRDRGCRWPGCNVPAAWTDAHHLVDWYYGGETNIDRLLLLCRWHHMLVHEGQWSIAFDDLTGEVAVTRPDGSPYELGPSQAWRLPRDSSSLSGHEPTEVRPRGPSQRLDESPPGGTVA